MSGHARDEIAFGAVAAGWTPAAWIERLRQMAERCEPARPEMAAWYREWARMVEQAQGAAA